VWVEVAGPVSNIVRLSNLASTGESTSQVEVVNGEQPSVSADGKWLAFIRENHGRGGLWIKKLSLNAKWPDGGERQVVEDSCDVWEAAFEPGNQRIVFTASPRGQPKLFLVEVASGQIAPLPFMGPARYPAFSPDGKWLAYSRRERGNWHLYVTRPGSTASRRLTAGECNSSSPAWEADSKSLIYATDARRGLDMTALARMTINPDPE
jgi:Tol biopolymer transport system component